MDKSTDFINNKENKELSYEAKLSNAVIKGLSRTYSCIYLLNITKGLMRSYYLQNAFFKDISREIGLPEGQIVPWRPVVENYSKGYVIEEDRQSFLNELSNERISERLETEDSYSFTFRCPAYDNGIVYVNLSVIHAENDGDNKRVILAFRDVTQETIHAQAELADRLKTEMELEKHRHANEVKSQFLFNISHDIRTPMNSIMGFSELALKNIDNSDKAAEYIKKVTISGRQLLSLIDDLLDMSSLEFGKTVLNLEPCILRSEIGKIIDLYSIESSTKEIVINSELNLDDEAVLMDIDIFKRILGNLLSNAIKFTPANGSITVKAWNDGQIDSDSSRYILQVVDNGVGISDDFIGKIFEAFEKETSSTKTGIHGTGLGLSVVKKLLEIMGGKINVKSKKNEGSTFTIELPLKSAPLSQTSDAAGMENDLSEKKVMRVLLVEDIEFNRMLAETILVDAGFLVESVPDGSDAVEAVKDHPTWYYDLILMDIQMPVMNGYEATRAIRAIDREDISSLPIIALSANSRDEDKRQSLKSGMNSHISKPFDVDELIELINNYAIKDRNRPPIKRR